MADEKVDLIKAVKSPFTSLYWVKVIMYILGAIFLFLAIAYPNYYTYFKKQKPIPTTSIGTAGTVNQDCSRQVYDAIIQWEKNNKKEKPWINLRIWKIIQIGIGGT